MISGSIGNAPAAVSVSQQRRAATDPDSGHLEFDRVPASRFLVARLAPERVD